MIIYWCGCLISLCLAWFCQHVKHNPLKEKKQKKITIWISALPLILIAGLRYGVGQDYFFTYVPYFERIQIGSVNEKLEPVYHYLNEIISFLFGDYVWVFIICSIIFMIFVYEQIFEDSPYPLFSIYLLIGMSYYFIFMNAMRQMVGCAILLFSLRYVQQKKIKPFSTCVLIATGFHISCIVFLFVYFIQSIKLKPRIMAATTIILFLLSKPIGTSINDIILKTQYSGYVGSIYDKGETGYIILLMNIAITIFAAFYYVKEKKYQLYFNLQVIAMWISAFSGDIVLINRIRWFFGLPGIILVPLVVSKIKNKKIQFMVSALIILLYFVYITYTIGVKNGNNVLPYHTIFFR
ncbi:EpsG family protein [Amedibacillus sp. YH-ame6]